MSAANTDNFLKVVANFSTTIGSGGVANGTVTTIPLDSDSGLPTDTAVEVVINRVTSSGVVTNNYETVRGVVSGTNLVSCVRGVEGTAQGWSAGLTVEYLATADIQNRLIDGILVEHSQLGVHSSALVTSLKASGANVTTGTSDVTIVTPKALADAGIVLDTTTTLGTSDVKVPSQKAVKTYVDVRAGANGWLAAGTFTYASADAPTYVVTVASGAASIYNVGDRIMLTDSTVKYFIVTAVADTSLTVYGGTDYTLSGGAISSPYYSHHKSPVGFPVSPVKWTVTTTDTNTLGQTPPTDGTWYNLGSLSISIPIGAWKVGYSVCINAASNASQTVAQQDTTLSTANNSASDTGFTCKFYIGGASATWNVLNTNIIEKPLTVTSKTAYYLNTMTGANMATIQLRGTLSATVIRAICAYL